MVCDEVMRHLTRGTDSSSIPLVYEPRPSEPKLPDDSSDRETIKQRLWEVIFEAETPSGKFFDVALLWVIGLSVLAVMLESVNAIRTSYRDILIIAEWSFHHHFHPGVSLAYLAGAATAALHF